MQFCGGKRDVDQLLIIRRDPGTSIHPHRVRVASLDEETSELLMVDGGQVYKHHIARPHVHTNPSEYMKPQFKNSYPTVY